MNSPYRTPGSLDSNADVKQPFDWDVLIAPVIYSLMLIFVVGGIWSCRDASQKLDEVKEFTNQYIKDKNLHVVDEGCYSPNSGDYCEVSSIDNDKLTITICRKGTEGLFCYH